MYIKTMKSVSVCLSIGFIRKLCMFLDNLIFVFYSNFPLFFFNSIYLKFMFCLYVVATKPTAGVNNAPTLQGVNNNAGSAGGDGAAGGGVVKTATVHANTVILKSVSAFLASGKRNSSNQSKTSEVSLKTKRRLKKEKMDELSGKINPKLLEQLRKKTKFNK